MRRSAVRSRSAPPTSPLLSGMQSWAALSKRFPSIRSMRSRSDQQQVCGTDHDLALSKSPLQFALVVLPPGAIEPLHHHLEHHDVVARHASGFLPEATCGRARICGEAAKPAYEFTFGLRKMSF